MPRQRNIVQRKEQIKALEKELSDKQIDNLSDAELKTLVIRMLREMIEYGCKIKEEVKAVQIIFIHDLCRSTKFRIREEVIWSCLGG